ncbi:MAG: hypothetical protein ABIH23_19740 [bacterium]
MKREFVGPGVIAFAFIVIAVCAFWAGWTIAPQLWEINSRSDMSEPIAKIKELAERVKAVNDYIESSDNPTREGAMAAFDGLPTVGTGSIESSSTSFAASGGGHYIAEKPNCYGVWIDMTAIKLVEPTPVNCKSFREVAFISRSGDSKTMTYNEFARRMK